MNNNLTNKVVDKMVEKNFERRSELLKKGSIILNADFDDVLMEDVYFNIQQLADDKNVSDIKIYINSHGGKVMALMPIVNLIDSITTKNVHTIVMGKAYSAAAILAICGHKGYRYAHKDSEILFHEISIDNDYVKNTQFQIDANRMDELNTRLVEIITQRTKMTKTQIKEYMNSNIDKFMTAIQALKLQVIDKVI